MEPLIAEVAAAAKGWLLVGTGVLSVGAFVASVAVLVLTARETEAPRLGLARGCCAVLAGVLVGTSFWGAVTNWALALSCLGLMLSLEAVALAFGRLAPLRSYLARETVDGEPGWWGEFERGFRRYSAHPGRERNPLQRPPEHRPAERQPPGPPSES